MPEADSTARALTPTAEALLAMLRSSRLKPRTKTALILVTEGVGYRRACKLVGGGDPKDLHRAARRYGLTEIHLERAREAAQRTETSPGA